MVKLIKVSVLAAVFATGFVNPVGAQVKRQESATFFFSDENYTEQVGFFVRFCDGSFSRGGTATLYSQDHYYGCN
ncbi:DUF6289 family protein [Sphingomonas desiccabilis]|uniref:Uncharacterized protein n=1 Tax=Sphingomonas desiccabilis TaxID=429134 RepID=A0A4Q2ISR7_9SPHN|nr:DUF6289 family protein [Sphingomonas desiccabilis]MBB3911738.1 hypothetical protein [Sphingomonas desiccabilis]RXZ31537.1 hypothetical protein EO081_09855 [Sphingomonas desiccabilis]